MVSESGDGAEAVEVFLVGRTLRGTLGDEFRRAAVGRFERMHGAGSDPRTSLSRTVELTAVAVTRAGRVHVDAVIADPAFAVGRPVADGPGEGRPLECDETAISESIVFESMPGARPVAGPPGVDRSRTVTVTVQPAARHTVSVRFTLVD